ncbi:NUDIX domain-containing protein [Brevibacillus sp. NPDC058079]|uniref:NUDIX domain-containing protein n=1 Tax=Brevibacillus sp. NPDC058079 TaxID=3346330 RepID=UPI0036ECE38A
MKKYVVAVIFNPTMEETLLLHRNREPYANMLNGIGGKIEEGETPNEAFLREMQEETGISSSLIDFYQEMVKMTFPNGVELVCFYAILACEPVIWEKNKEGIVAWYNIEELDLLNASHSMLAGDGNISYMIQFARNLERIRQNTL